MQLTSTRKKANAITSNILNRIAVRGQRKVADALGINESQISRWKDSFIPKMGMLLAVLEWGVEDEELAELATPAHDKDCWQTPLWLFDALDIEFGFWLDSAASDKNALCAHWLTEADDALNSEWVSHGAIWNNPPYSNIRPWVEKAAEQCIQQRQTVVMLVPEDMSVGWFSKALESVDEVRIITDGRINFIEPSTGLEKKGNSKGSMLLIWRPFISPRRMFTTVSKAALMAIGQGVRRAA
ncbi:phage N-6-adenine-methyltransferase [Escherichia coli]|nr:phage N-6-adenine-methyltransferase [Escherichia coli]EFU8315296.1 phage N-6-adenine-methyltransferase [Escherichia coli]